MLFIPKNGLLYEIRGLYDEYAQKVINAFPFVPDGFGIKNYLTILIRSNRVFIFMRYSEIIYQYLRDVRMRLLDDPLLLYDPENGIVGPPELLQQEGLNEYERIEEQEWQRDFELHYERDRDRDRPLDRDRLAEICRRRKVIPMQGRRYEDFKLCDSRTFEYPGAPHINARWRRINHVTWHHAENITPVLEGDKVIFLCDMYLVDQQYHAGRGFHHSGGCAEYSRYTCCKYR